MQISDFTYLCGMPVAYLIIRRASRKDNAEKGKPGNWGDIGMAMAFSLFSWFVPLICIIGLAILYISRIKLPKPPNWL